MRVGIAGLGRMGRAIAERLRGQGCEVCGWNRSAVDETWRRDAQVTVLGDLGALARETDFVLTSLFDDRAVLDVYLGPGGLLSGAAGPCRLVDLSTVRPGTAVAVAAAAAGRAQVLDVPVLGTVLPAREGRLIALAGGTDEAFADALPLLRLIARRIEHLGPSGSGAAAKLALNIPMSVYWTALSDGLALAERFGVDRLKVLDILADSPAALMQLPMKMDVLSGHDRSVGASIDMVVKDLRLMLEVASETGRRISTVEAALALYERAQAAGRGLEDVAAVAAADRAAEGPRLPAPGAEQAA